METPLLTVAPETPADDERVIAAGYQRWITPLLVALPLGTAYFAEMKWVIAVGFAALLVVAHENGGRLHDLCIRRRRTNVLLSERKSGN
jgi:hypothetical protein